MRIRWIAAMLILCLALPLSAQQTTPEAPDQNDPLPTCADLYNANLRVSGSEDAVLNGAVYCREIARDGEYLVNPGAIGNQRVIERGVLQAYDVFSLTVGGGSAQPFTHAITVCLQGRGDLLFMPVFGSPRPALNPPATRRGDYTCANIGSPGIVALVNQGQSQ